MFNLFKKEASVKTSSSYPQVVQEIHNEFLSAGDKILQEAQSILSKAKTKNLEKGKRLASLGFKNVPEAVTALEVKRTMVTTRELADLVQYYQINYPNNKFITEEQVKAICEKYGLVCGEIEMYKGFVPENKLSIIEKFSLRKKDYPTMYMVPGIGLLSKKDLNKHYVGVEPVSKQMGFNICAPLKDMEIPQGKEVRGYKIQNIPDPVVLQPVKGGYLIVCAWGDEASDEIVVNQINN